MFEKLSAYLGYQREGGTARKFYPDFSMVVQENGEVYFCLPGSEPVCVASKSDIERAFVEAERLGVKYSEDRL